MKKSKNLMINRKTLLLYRVSSNDDLKVKHVLISAVHSLQSMKVKRIVLTNDLMHLLNAELWSEEMRKSVEQDETILLYEDVYLFKEFKALSNNFELDWYISDEKRGKKAGDLEHCIYPEDEKVTERDFDYLAMYKKRHVIE